MRIAEQKPIALPHKTLCAQLSDTKLGRFRASGIELHRVTCSVPRPEPGQRCVR